MLRTFKRLIPVFILLFWLVMVAGLLHREVLMPRMYRGLTSRRIDIPQNVWLGFFFGEDQQVGYVHIRTAPEERDEEKGYWLSATARVAFPILGQETRLNFSGTAWMSALVGLREFDFQLTAADHDMRITGDVHDGVVDAVLHTAGETIPFKLPVGDELLLSGGLGLTAASLPRLAPGQIAYVDAFDPTSMSVGRAKIEALRHETLEFGGEPVNTTVIATTIAGITTRAWVSDDEEIIRAETPFGLIIKKIEPQEALAPSQADVSADIVRAVAVEVRGAAPDPSAAQFRLRITGLDETLTPPEDTRQRRENDAWLIVRQNPRDDTLTEPFTAEDAETYLGSDMFIQTNHPRIQQTAGEIVGSEDDAWAMAVRIHDWLYENVAKENVLSVPSAISVLDTLQGDCNEHAVLFAALARAVGIPTRIAIGLAWSSEMSAFGYHAWPEVYIGRWIAMDPTLGERTVSPTHLKLFTGGIDQWPRLIAYVGTLELEILEE